MSTPPAGPPVDPPGSVPASPPEPSAPVCPRHRDRVSYVSCQRCGRPTCYECQRDAAVGKQCVDCVRESARTAPTARTRFGAAVTSGPPYVTWGLIGLCVLVFLGQQLDGSLTDRLSFIGVLAEQEPWRFVTTAFVHSPTNPTHILFNMYVLWAFGPQLERAFGRLRYLAVYLLAAVGGSVGVLWMGPVDPGWFTSVVGASGALFGLLFLHLVLAVAGGRTVTPLVVLLAINLALPLVVGGIAWQAHLGGAATGAVTGLLMLLTSASGRDASARRRRAWSWPALGLVAVVLAALAAVRLVAVLG